MAFNGATSQTVEYLGDLFQQYKRANALVRLMGGLGNVKTTTSYEFPIGAFYDLPAPSQVGRLEGGVAPTPITTTLSQTSNVIQIFQESVSLTYLAQSEQSVSGIVPIPQGEVNRPAQNPRSQEFQIQRALEKIQQDLNYSCLNGTFNNPGDPTSSGLTTRGIIPSLTTNIVDQSAASGSPTAATVRGWIAQLLSQMIQYNGYQISRDFYLLAGNAQFLNVVNAFTASNTQFVSPEEQVVGIMVRQIATTFGVLNLVLEPDVPANTLLVVYADVLGLVGQPVPGKGILFEEPLYKQGSSDQTQIYGQLGMDHGPEYLHGLLKVPAGLSIGE